MNAVQSNGQRLSQRTHLIAHALGQLDQQIGGVAEILAHTAVNMHAQHLQAGAAVGPANGAGIAVAAVDIGVHSHAVAHFQALGILSGIGGNADDLTAELVADDAGIADQTVGAAEGADVTAADGGAVNLDQSFSFLGLGIAWSTQSTFQGSANLMAFIMISPFLQCRSVPSSGTQNSFQDVARLMSPL